MGDYRRAFTKALPNRENIDEGNFNKKKKVKTRTVPLKYYIECPVGLRFEV